MKKILCLFILVNSLIFPCTGITIKTLNNSEIISARTIEYGENNLNSELVMYPRNTSFQSLTPEGKLEGLKWQGKYGFVGISVINNMFIGEGMNEVGLNAGLFYFPHYGSLEKYNPKNNKNNLVDMQLVSWILSNFSTVEEVKNNIDKINIINIGFEKDGTPLPTAHWRVTDANGGNIVIEITNNGKINIFDNKVGVLTNSPDYEWHIKNLNNYINLYSGNAQNYDFDTQKIFSFGAGTGGLGLPGDITPPSRFVRAFYYLMTLPKTENFKNAIAQAFHILNNFDIPIGVEYSKEHQNYIPKDLLSATQWTTVCALKNKEFYYKTMYDSQIKKVDLRKIDFSGNQIKAIKITDDFKLNYKEVEFE